jgi:hypothetical protein
VNYKLGTMFLALTIGTAAPAVADSVPGHSKDANKYVTFSEDFLGQQDSPRNTAKCNFLSGSPKETGSRQGALSAASFSGFTTGGSGTASLKLADFGPSDGSPGNDSSGNKDKGKPSGKDNDGPGSGVGGGTPSPLISVPEPGSQSLLLLGLAGLGMVFHRRKTLTNAI